MAGSWRDNELLALVDVVNVMAESCELTTFTDAGRCQPKVHL